MLKCDTLSEALDMAAGTEVLAASTSRAGEVLCAVRVGSASVAVRLRESLPGAGDWHPIEMAVREGPGSRLGAAAIRDLRWAEILRKAVAAAQTQGPPSPIVEPDAALPAAFASGRRGQTQRTERDYAALALHCVVQWPGASWVERARLAAKHSQGMGEHAWRKHMARAKDYVDNRGGLTADGWRLLGGDLALEALEVELNERVKELDGELRAARKARQAGRATDRSQRLEVVRRQLAEVRAALYPGDPTA